jgi:hypothetical protein
VELSSADASTLGLACFARTDSSQLIALALVAENDHLLDFCAEEKIEGPTYHHHSFQSRCRAATLRRANAGHSLFFGQRLKFCS